MQTHSGSDSAVLGVVPLLLVLPPQRDLGPRQYLLDNTTLKLN